MTPRIVIHGAQQLVEFVKYVFGATGEYRPDLPCVISIGDLMVVISEAGIRNPMTAFLYVYVDDTDEVHRRAIQTGARSLEEPSDMPYGDRRSMVEDEWGNTWQIATYMGQHDAAEQPDGAVACYASGRVGAHMEQSRAVSPLAFILTLVWLSAFGGIALVPLGRPLPIEPELLRADPTTTGWLIFPVAFFLLCSCIRCCVRVAEDALRPDDVGPGSTHVACGSAVTNPD